VCFIEIFTVGRHPKKIGLEVRYEAWLARTSFEKGCAYSGVSFEMDLVDDLGFSWSHIRSMGSFHWWLMFQTSSSLFSLMFDYVCFPSF